MDGLYNLVMTTESGELCLMVCSSVQTLMDHLSDAGEEEQKNNCVARGW